MNCKITFSKRDVLLQNFFNTEIEDAQLNISYLVELSITHYALTGKYLPVGTVTTDEPKEYITAKAVYFKKGGLAERYLNEQKMLGMAYNASVKLILEQSLIIGGENKLMTKAEYLAQRQKINAYLLNGEKPSLGLYNYAHSRKSKKESGEAVKARRVIPAEEQPVMPEKIDRAPERSRQKTNKTGKSDLSFADNFVFGDIE